MILFTRSSGSTNSVEFSSYTKCAHTCGEAVASNKESDFWKRYSLCETTNFFQEPNTTLCDDIFLGVPPSPPKNKIAWFCPVKELAWGRSVINGYLLIFYITSNGRK